MKNSILSKKCLHRLELAIVSVLVYDLQENEAATTEVIDGVAKQILEDINKRVEAAYRTPFKQRLPKLDFASIDKTFTVAVELEYEKPAIKIARRVFIGRIGSSSIAETMADMATESEKSNLDTIDALVAKYRNNSADFYKMI